MIDATINSEKRKEISVYQRNFFLQLEREQIVHKDEKTLGKTDEDERTLSDKNISLRNATVHVECYIGL